MYKFEQIFEDVEWTTLNRVVGFVAKEDGKTIIDKKGDVESHDSLMKAVFDEIGEKYPFLKFRVSHPEYAISGVDAIVNGDILPPEHAEGGIVTMLKFEKSDLKVSRAYQENKKLKEYEQKFNDFVSEIDIFAKSVSNKPTPARCSCGKLPRKKDRFCSQCGSKIEK